MTFLVLANVAWAQISVKEGSFKKVDGFVNIDDKQYDDNGATISLNGKVLKVKTSYTNKMIAAGRWDFVGEGNINVKRRYDGWIDLFG